MKKLAIIIVTVLCALPMTATTQQYDGVKADTITGLRHYKFWDNWFIGFHAGANASLGENVRPRDVKDVIGPSFGLSVGKYFSPAVGARVQGMFNFLTGKAHHECISMYPKVFGDKGLYDFKDISVHADALFNLSNIFSQYKESRRFNVVGFIGLGIIHTLGFNDLTTWTTQAKERPYPVNTDDRTAIGMRAGLQLNYKLSNPLDLALDIAMNASDDKFNGVVYDDHYDGYVSAMIGLIYHFKDHYGDRRFMDINWTDADELARMNRNINDLRDQLRNTKPRVEYRDEYHYIDVLQTTVSFEIDKYNITKIQKKNVAEVAKYLENHPEVNLVVCGYADVETAYPEYNLKLSENRAKAVYNMLVKDFNVQPDRLRIDFKGDTVQPYGLKNEWNRVVIFVTEPNNK